MFDNLRQQAAQAAEDGDAPAARPRGRSLMSSSGRVLGMTPPQLFVLSLMIFMLVSLFGCLALVIFEKVKLF